nr:immunoglobulin light chain junction region [Macaca mulatta]MOX31161.1 immunoglobulin light chain junction region [Macaca mulatta]MOX31614.1 immunoglobulin light chain junction region [Macaca mulatta]
DYHCQVYDINTNILF